MGVYHGKIPLPAEYGHPVGRDITSEVERHVSTSGVRDGLCLVYSPHTTCSVIIQESSHDTMANGTEYLQQDLCNGMETLFPTYSREGQYLHPGPEHLAYARQVLGEDPGYSLNTDAHLRSVLFGRSQTVPVRDGVLRLGRFGRFFFIDWDHVRERDRVCEVTIQGE